LGAAFLLLVLTLQPIRPPCAGGTARFRQIESEVVACSIQNWLLIASALALLPSPRNSNRQVSFVSTGSRMQVASVKMPRKSCSSTVGAFSEVA
jgi:hypothetical protein